MLRPTWSSQAAAAPLTGPKVELRADNMGWNNSRSATGRLIARPKQPIASRISAFAACTLRCWRWPVSWTMFRVLFRASWCPPCPHDPAIVNTAVIKHQHRQLQNRQPLSRQHRQPQPRQSQPRQLQLQPQPQPRQDGQPQLR